MTEDARAVKIAEITERHEAAIFKGSIELGTNAATDRAALLAIVAKLEEENKKLRNGLKWIKDQAPATQDFTHISSICDFARELFNETEDKNDPT